MKPATKEFKFYMKDVKDAGTFEGMAAVYGNVDLGGDVIEPGAFTRTIKNSGGKVPILWQHDQREPIGMGVLRDSKEGLVMNGQLVLESDVARKALGLMKANVLSGLSIGYDTIVSEYDKARDVRRLKELKLWEVSLVTFPMNPKAQVTAVKSSMEEIGAALRAMMAGIKNGQPITPEMRDVITRAGDEFDEIRALIAMDPGNDSIEPPAQLSVSDSDLHSLITSLREIV